MNFFRNPFHFLLFFIVCCNSQTCSTVNIGALGTSIVDAYTCCYSFTNPVTPNYDPPFTGSGETIINMGNPIRLANGNSQTQMCTGGKFYYETSSGYFSSSFVGSNGVIYEDIDSYYTLGAGLYQRNLPNSKSTLRDVISGRRTLLFITCNGISSCLRWNVTGQQTSNGVVSNGDAIDFTGSTSNCETTANTTYLTKAYTFESVSEPNVTILFDTSIQKVAVNIEAWYLPSNASYIIRFSQFNKSSDEINNPGTCENRLASSYLNKPFSSWWSHASNAKQTGALNNLSRLAYGPSGNWSQFALDCARVRWSRNFSLSEFSLCKKPNGSNEITIRDLSTTQGIITYQGSLFVTGVIGVMTTPTSGIKLGYSVKTWEYPFKMTFQSTSGSQTLLSNGGNFLSAVITETSIINTGSDTGKMLIEIRTTFYPASFGFVGNHSLISTTGTELTLTGSPATIIQTSPAIQRFVWVSNTVRSTYDGIYRFRWNGFDCTTPSDQSTCSVTNSFDIQFIVMLRAQPPQNSTSSLSSYITVYQDTEFKTPKTSKYVEGFPICVKNTINVPLEDSSIYQNTIVNVFLCSPNNSTGILAYDGLKTFGCKNQTLVSQIASNGLTDSQSLGSSVFSYYNPSIRSMTRSIDSGICFKARPKIMLKSGSYFAAPIQYIHMDILIKTTTSSYVKTIFGSVDEKNYYSIVNQIQEDLESNSAIDIMVEQPRPKIKYVFPSWWIFPFFGSFFASYVLTSLIDGWRLKNQPAYEKFQ